MQPTHPCSAPTCRWLADGSLWATSLLVVVVRHVICGFYLVFPPGYVDLWDSKTPHRPADERVSWFLETYLLLWLPPWSRSPSLTLLSLFLSFIFCPTSFQRQWLPFWVPGALHQCLEFVLWNLLRGQMIFQWICGGETGLPILFLHHLWTALLLLFKTKFSIDYRSFTKYISFRYTI